MILFYSCKRYFEKSCSIESRSWKTRSKWRI